MSYEDDERIERLAEYLKQQLTDSTNARFDDIAGMLDQAPPLELGEEDCIFLGYDDQVEAVMAVPSPLPSMLRRPIVRRVTAAFPEGDDSIRPTFATADYDQDAPGSRIYRRRVSPETEESK